MNLCRDITKRINIDFKAKSYIFIEYLEEILILMNCTPNRKKKEIV